GGLHAAHHAHARRRVRLDVVGVGIRQVEAHRAERARARERHEHEASPRTEAEHAGEPGQEPRRTAGGDDRRRGHTPTIPEPAGTASAIASAWAKVVTGAGLCRRRRRYPWSVDNYWLAVIWSLLPTVVVSAIFFFVLRSVVRADRNERREYARIEAEERAKRGLPPVADAK